MRLVLPLAIAAAFLAALPASAIAAEKAALRQSIGKSMALLDKAQVRFARQATCASCHNQIDPMVAASVLRSKGVPINDAVYNSQLASTVEVIKARHDYSLGHSVGAGAHAVTGAIMTGLAQVNFPADENTDAGVVYLLAKQLPNGSWPTVAVRFPHGETPFDVTARSVKALNAYAPPALRQQVDARIARARTWLIATPASDNQDALVYRLKGLSWAKAPSGEVRKAMNQLVAVQKPDGGWSQRPGMAADAYATGGALLALHTAGMKPSDPVYQRGLDYLLRTQAADGSWHVRTHALPIQPPIDSGFPYGPDQWISSWATTYAAEAMAYAL